MYVSPFFVYAGATVVVGILTRVSLSFKRDRAARKAMGTTLFPPSSLDAVFASGSTHDDDPNILTELNTTLTHLNRQAFAEEFWNVDKDLIKYYRRIPARSRPTMERALVRMIESDQKWLQVVGAKTCAGLKIVAASAPLSEAIQKSDSDPRFKAELESSAEILTTLNIGTH